MFNITVHFAPSFCLQVSQSRVPLSPPLAITPSCLADLSAAALAKAGALAKEDTPPPHYPVLPVPPLPSSPPLRRPFTVRYRVLYLQDAVAAGQTPVYVASAYAFAAAIMFAWGLWYDGQEATEIFAAEK